MFRVLICGSREWTDQHVISALVQGLRAQADAMETELVIIHGGARGADSLADWYGRKYAHEVIEEAVSSDEWRILGKYAGHIRNQRMLNNHKPDVVYAFRCNGKSNGTDNMIQISREAGVPVYVVRKED